MLRNRNLFPLSHQHQHGLALCVRVRSGLREHDLDEPTLARFRRELKEFYSSEGGAHLAAEEELIFPAADRSEDLRPLTARLRSEHAELRNHFARADSAAREEMLATAELLTKHIRTEENELFERMQQLMSADELAAIGAALERTIGWVG